MGRTGNRFNRAAFWSSTRGGLRGQKAARAGRSASGEPERYDLAAPYTQTKS